MSESAAPRGAEAVRSALLAAATDLFADRGPSHVSVREIARAAGVNHGLVHHYFGSKDALLRAVLDELASESASEVAAWDGHSGLLEAEGAVGRHGRIVAHLLLDARNPADVQTTFPAIDALIAHLRIARVGCERRRGKSRGRGRSGTRMAAVRAVPRACRRPRR